MNKTHSKNSATVDDSASSLPLLNAKLWALGFLGVALVVAITFSTVLIEFMANAH